MVVESGAGDAHDDESMTSPANVQNISSVTVGYGLADNTGEILCMQSYEEDLVEMVNAYTEQQSEGRRFVHVRKRNSINRDLRAMQHLMGSSMLYSVKLKTGRSKATRI